MCVVKLRLFDAVVYDEIFFAWDGATAAYCPVAHVTFTRVPLLL